VDCPDEKNPMTKKLNITQWLKKIESMLPKAMHADRQASKREINRIGATPRMMLHHKLSVNCKH
jgi:hypothetical protein